MSRLSDDPEVLNDAISKIKPKLDLPDKASPVATAALATVQNTASPAPLTQKKAKKAKKKKNDKATTESINAGRDDVIALRSEVVTYEEAISALRVDVEDVRSQLNALLSSLEDAGQLTK